MKTTLDKCNFDVYKCRSQEYTTKSYIILGVKCQKKIKKSQIEKT